MALQLENGNYVKIDKVDVSGRVYVQTYENKAQRDRFKSGTNTKFEQSIGAYKNVNLDLSSVDSSKNIEDNLITQAYVALKLDTEYAGATDV